VSLAAGLSLKEQAEKEADEAPEVVDDFEVKPGAEVKLKTRLGKGATAVVWSGTVDQKMVAIKQIQLRKYKEGISHGQKVIQREYNIVRTVQHPAIVRYFGMFYNKADEEVNLVMEFIDGVSVTDLVLYCHSLSETQAAFVLRGVIQAVQHLHSKGIMHRDLKPDNVLLTMRGFVKLIDFGTAARDDPKNAVKRRSTVGTPWYCAPEVINSEEYAFACDIWSLGCFTIELISGKPPFDDLNDIQCLYKMSEGVPPPFPPAATPNVKDFLNRVLNPDWRKRPTAEELLRLPILNLPPNVDAVTRKQLLKSLHEMTRVKADFFNKTMRVMKTKQRGNVNISEWK